MHEWKSGNLAILIVRNFKNFKTDPNSIKYTERDYNNLILASAFGTLFFTLPFNWIYTKFGARFVFFGAGIVSIFSTALVPLCAQLGFLWLYVARFVQVQSFKLFVMNCVHLRA